MEIARRIVESAGEKVSEALARLTLRKRTQVVAADLRRTHKRRQRAAFRAARGGSGYCCPRCHTWHPTPEARKTCRESHWRTKGADAGKAVA